MLVLSLVSWLLIGIAAAWLGKTLASDRFGWFGLGVFGILGAITGGLAMLWASDAWLASDLGAALGALLGVFIRGAAEEIRSQGPGLAV
jgi:uncharacterized membrane protein YeaQ/YmgE (transglycosylase-associated protein family)